MVDIKDIEKLSQLARIHLPEDEKAGLAKEIEAILAYVAQINEAGKGGERAIDIHRNIMRDDNAPHETGAFTERLLAASPNRQGNYFKVKKILN